MNIHEYEVGLKKNELDTPALLVDLDIVDRNIQRMAEYCKSRGIYLRPHAKVYKATPIFAWKQLRAGAIGITVSKLSEAEVLASAGIKNILIANQVVGQRKITRLVNLASYTEVIVAVDSIINVEDISAAATKNGSIVGVLVEVNIGNNRCGVEPFRPTLSFVEKIINLPGIKFCGLMGYDGHLAFVADLEKRFEASQETYKLLIKTRDVLINAGIPVDIVSGGGTSTYKSAAEVKGLTELQIGTYLFSDTTYRDAGLVEFECALTVLSTVISRPDRPGAEDLAILDVGKKGISTNYGFPEVKSIKGEIYSMPQEHSRLKFDHQDGSLKIGDLVELWVKDSNGTVNMYDQIIGVRGNNVEAVWDLSGRGKVT